MIQRKLMRRAPKLVLAPAPIPSRNVRAAIEPPSSGYVLVVDGQMKDTFNTRDAARERAETLKRRFPALQVRIFDAEEKRSEDVGLAEA